jgi:hypothetical protein
MMVLTLSAPACCLAWFVADYVCGASLLQPLFPWGLTADKAPHSSGSSRPGSLTRG